MITTTFVCTVLQRTIINDHRGHAIGVCQLDNEIESLLLVYNDNNYICMCSASAVSRQQQPPSAHRLRLRQFKGHMFW